MRARAWLAAVVLGLVGVLMLGVFPARTLVAKRNERSETSARVEQQSSHILDLQARANLLNTDAEIERLARQHYDLVRPGEEIFTIVAPPPAPQAAPEPAPEPPDRSWARRVVTRLMNVF